jgi:PAS domain S-box-containing protein
MTGVLGLLRLNTIRMKFLAFIIPPVLLSTFLVFGLFEYNARIDATQKLQDKLDKLITIQSVVVAESLWNIAGDQIKLLLAALAVDPDVERAVVYDDRDRIVATVGSNKQTEESSVFASEVIVYNDGNDPEIIGRLTISLNDVGLRSAARERMPLAAALAAILLVSVVVSALLANRRTIGIPLERLLVSINQKRKVGKRQVVDWRSNDEIGAVISAFNEMQERQNAYEQELEEARDTLERSVEERTGELDSARKILVNAIESISEGFSLYDQDDRLVLFNSRYRELLYPGFEHLVVAGKTFEEIIRGAVDHALIKDAEGRIDKWVAERLKQHLNPSGAFEQPQQGEQWFQISERKTDDGGIVAVYTDITKRKLSEAKLLEGEERLKLALKGGDLGFWDINLETGSIVANERWAEMLGYSLDEVDDLRDVAQATFHPDDRERLADYNRSNLEGEIVDYEIEYRVITKQGETRWQLSKGYTVELNERGKPRRSVGIVTDITGRKKVEEAFREKSHMLESLSNQLAKYLSPQVYESIFSGKQEVKVASRRKKLTVFFSDIVGFTETTDNLEAEELSDLLNHYLTEMSNIALAHGATIDKYVGDAILAFFGDPETKGVREDAQACVLMAIDMQRRMRALELEWQDAGLERPFRIRVGINTGFCTVGNFGSKDRMDYTIIGNEVNLSSRLESSSEIGGILISHETYSLVKDIVAAEEQKPLTVKGFAEPVRNYKVSSDFAKLVEEGRLLRKEKLGVKLEVDWERQDRAAAIETIEEFLSEIRG